MNSTNPTTVAGGDEPDRVPNTAIELSTSPNSNAHSISLPPPNRAMNTSKPTPGDQAKANWVQFEEDDDERNHAPPGVGAGSPQNIALQSVAAGTPNRLETVTTVPQRPHSPAQNNKSSPSPLQDVAPAVLATESVHVNLNNSSNTSASPPKITNTTTTSGPTRVNASTQKNAAVSPITTPPPAASDMSQMRTIELSTGRVREGFANGDVIVTLLPVNTKWPWITPAVFRPELVPEELMAQGLTLTVEEYVNAMETLVNDYRFTLYNVCYKRVLVCWILFAFCVLLALLFSGLQGIALFSLGVGWLFLNAAAIFLCMWIKLKLSRGLEKCLARVNKQLARHKILLVLDDRGRISCHKVNLCFLYFDPAQCVAYLNSFLDRSEQNGTTIQAGWEARLDLDVSDIVIQGSNPTRLSRKQERGLLLYLRYGSRWGNEIVRGVGEVSITEPARHCANSICPCQYIERHISCKPRGHLLRFLIGDSPFDLIVTLW
ncbi:transmembrane protein 268 isoform X3 [Hermetia illucens]|uniref:transmembrane protein 268 isoform X3 n=1 Tax=Hermetia illucens TaxID=343691 RepID=UPI0018CC1ABD|nr:transmembrane protein 268 isoform X3 [Hermetia illucens]